jgi:hypothetical protein
MARRAEYVWNRDWDTDPFCVETEGEGVRESIEATNLTNRNEHRSKDIALEYGLDEDTETVEERVPQIQYPRG